MRSETVTDRPTQKVTGALFTHTHFVNVEQFGDFAVFHHHDTSCTVYARADGKGTVIQIYGMDAEQEEHCWWAIQDVLDHFKKTDP